MEEKELVRRLKERDSEAFNYLVEKYGGRLYNMALRMMNNREDAQDVVQETFLTVINKIDQFQEKSSIYTWMYKIALNYIFARFRERARISDEVQISDPDFNRIHTEELLEIPEIDRNLLTSEKFRQMVQEAVEELPDIYRVVFILRDLQNLSTEETARILGISISNVKIRLMRARVFLREKLLPRLREYMHG